jgi:glutathione S-transferase
MKLYDYRAAPSPRRVRMFLAEKGLAIDTVQVDLRALEQLGAEFRTVNPQLVVPFLLLDDGTGIGETRAICRYFELLHPDPPLFGRSAKEQALVEMWDRRMEFDGFLAIAEAFRNSTPGFKGRALPGPVGYEQIPALAERGRVRVGHFFDALEERCAQAPWIAGDRLSVADITGFISVDFAGWIKLKLPETHAHARRWYDVMAARPSAGA